MDKDVKKYLRDRINSCSPPSWRDRRRDVKVPASVRRARRIIARFDAEVRRKNRKIDRTYGKLKDRATHLLHFGTEKQTLAAVRKLEAFK